MLNGNMTTWIVVADGSKARIFHSHARDHLELESELKLDEARIHSHELGSEKPRGVFGRNEPESRVDLHHQAEEHFAKHLADLIYNGALDKKLQSLVLIAPPKFLGILRHLITPHHPQLINKEINKNLTHMSEEELKKYIWE